jgi:hypothetical protein
MARSCETDLERNIRLLISHFVFAALVLVVACPFVTQRLYRYNLHTALYMLEPWERALFNTVVLIVVAYAVYGMYSAAVYPLFERMTSSYS